jgi:hypothetical protein
MREQKMGTFEKAYEVDGELYELYLQEDDGDRRYQLVDSENLPLGAPFAELPDELTVIRLVRASNETLESAA